MAGYSGSTSSRSHVPQFWWAHVLGCRASRQLLRQRIRGCAPGMFRLLRPCCIEGIVRSFFLLAVLVLRRAPGVGCWWYVPFCGGCLVVGVRSRPRYVSPSSPLLFCRGPPTLFRAALFHPLVVGGMSPGASSRSGPLGSGAGSHTERRSG